MFLISEVALEGFEVSELGFVVGSWQLELEACSNAKQFQGGLVFKAHRLLYHSTLGRE